MMLKKNTDVLCQIVYELQCLITNKKSDMSTKKSNTSQPCTINSVSCSVFFAEDKYYHKHESWDKGEYFFKCENLHKGTDAFGMELYISPGKEMYRITDTAQFIYEGWEEITREDFIEKTKKYVSRAVESFS